MTGEERPVDCRLDLACRLLIWISRGLEGSDGRAGYRNVGPVIQPIAMCYTRIGMMEEAAKTYRHVLQKDPSCPGANYGLAFILLHSERPEQCIPHLEAFLAAPPDGADAEEHIDHARRTLAKLRGDAHDRAPVQPPPDDFFQ